MIKLSANIWELLNSVSSILEVTDSERYEIHKFRLELINKKIESLSSLKCIYIADYKHDINEKSKANLKVPVLLRKGANEAAIKTLLQEQMRLRTHLSYSFSDFIFGDLNKKVIFNFHKGEKNLVIFKNKGYCTKVSLCINRALLFNPLLKPLTEVISNEVKIVPLESLIQTNDGVSVEFRELHNPIPKSFFNKIKRILIESTFTEIPNITLEKILHSIILSLSVEGITGFTYIPNIAFKKANGVETSSGGFIVTHFSEQKQLTIQQESILYLLAKRWFSQNAIADFSNQAKESVLVHARKAAIAQVMLRNMSHNLGSHVLANLTQPQTILSIALENKTPNYSTNEELIKTNLIYKNAEQKEIKISSDFNSFDVAFSELNSYLRTRMDFLADISTGTAVIETTKNLKKDVTETFRSRNFLLKEFITGNNKRVIFNNPGADNIITSFPNDNLGV